MTKVRASARHRARRKALQALYQWQLAGSDLIDIERAALEDTNPKKTDIEYFRELLHAIAGNVGEIDETLSPYLDRAITQINPVELAVLRIATYELLKRLDIPYRIVINEALEHTKTFGASEGYKYVNGVLDNLAKTLRALEVGSS